ncbi:MAG: hypothetical protein COA79_15430 [Planctomycetota bacterium]|nr:MAG: hypothetical protein COA79_15430 [Planctomycetota bacterium]
MSESRSRKIPSKNRSQRSTATVSKKPAKPNSERTSNSNKTSRLDTKPTQKKKSAAVKKVTKKIVAAKSSTTTSRSPITQANSSSRKQVSPTQSTRSASKSKREASTKPIPRPKRESTRLTSRPDRETTKLSKRSSPASSKRSKRTSEREESKSKSGSQRRSSRKNAKRGSTSNNNMHIISGLGLAVLVVIVLIIMKMSGTPENKPTGIKRDAVGTALQVTNDAMNAFSKNRDSAPKTKVALERGRDMLHKAIDNLPEGQRSRYDRILQKINMSLKDMRERAHIVEARQGH